VRAGSNTSLPEQHFLKKIKNKKCLMVDFCADEYALFEFLFA